MVRARNGYFAARGRASEPKPSTSKALNVAIDEAMGSPLPTPGVPMKVFAAPFKGAAPNAAVAMAVEIDASKFDYMEKDGTWFEKVEVVSTATDANGKVYPGERQTVNLMMKPQTYERVKSRGLRVLTQANLPPGSVSAPRRVGECEWQGGRRDLRPRRPGLQQGAVHDERHRADVARGAGGHDDRAEESAARLPARSGDGVA
jgi:hypothetical protein